MLFNKHYNLKGLHAPFSASQSHWLRYNDTKAIEVYRNKKAAEMGTKLHEWAQNTIKLKIKQQRSNKTICAYVNDAIGFNMDTEVVLYYSDRFFGTADAISFRKNLLRIHDLKTGKEPAHMEQLYVYAALFCLEYKIKPSDIEMELRIYQNDQIMVDNPDPEVIVAVIEQIIHLDQLIEKEDYEEA